MFVADDFSDARLLFRGSGETLRAKARYYTFTANERTNDRLAWRLITSEKGLNEVHVHRNQGTQTLGIIVLPFGAGYQTGGGCPYLVRCKIWYPLPPKLTAGGNFPRERVKPPFTVTYS